MFTFCNPNMLQGEHPQIRAQSDPPPVDLSVGDIADPLRHPLPLKSGFHMPPRYANGHILATGDPIHFMFEGSRVEFSGTADRMALFTV